jgi:hypothetical protein
MSSRWRQKFRLKSGKWVFVPTQETIEQGSQIKFALEKKWTAPSYYFHLRSGGHLQALRQHIEHKAFAHLDVQNFFGSINKSRVTRVLKPLMSYRIARDWAVLSTVRDPDDNTRFMLPFGFVQSQLLASLCLQQSALGRCLKQLAETKNISVSVYVDDIIISSVDAEGCNSAFEKLIIAAERSQFFLNKKKQEGPSDTIKAFNIVLSHNSLQITSDRLDQFKISARTTGAEYKRDGILNYVKSVSTSQFNELIADI